MTTQITDARLLQRLDTNYDCDNSVGNTAVCPPAGPRALVHLRDKSSKKNRGRFDLSDARAESNGEATFQLQYADRAKLGTKIGDAFEATVKAGHNCVYFTWMINVVARVRTPSCIKRGKGFKLVRHGDVDEAMKQRVEHWVGHADSAAAQRALARINAPPPVPPRPPTRPGVKEPQPEPEPEPAPEEGADYLCVHR